MINFSIIICTYNPNREIFQRLLNALLQFDISSPEHEVIIVDNNSNPALNENELVKSFLDKKQNSKLITEKNPGLTSARIAGIKNAKYEWLIFFDDDNEPDINYLKDASNAIAKINTVGVWGPGVIDVIYVDGSSKWLETKKNLFQQRYNENTIYGYEKATQDYYPDGTGMLLLKKIALEYVEKIENSIYTLSDRNKKFLSSGGDLQIVLTATKLDYGVGRFKHLKLNHNIERRKTTLKYMSKLGFGLESCNYLAHCEVLEWGQAEIDAFFYASNNDILKFIYNRIVIQKLSFNNFILEFSRFVGQQIGIATLKKEKHPSILLNFASFIINR